MENVLINIEKHSKNNNEIDSAIAKYIIENLDNPALLTLKNIAQNCYTSPSTITRYAKKIGYQGFTELKIYLNDYVKEIKLITKKSNSKINAITETNLNFIIDSLIKTKNMFQEDSILKFYYKAKTAKNIYLFAQGGTFTIAYDFSIRLMRLKFNAQAINDPIIQAMLIRQANSDDDLFILISFSGQTNELVKAANTLNDKKIDYISMTSNRKNFIQQKAWLSFEVPYENSQLRKMLNSSRMYLFFLVDSITTYMAIHLDGIGLGVNLLNGKN